MVAGEQEQAGGGGGAGVGEPVDDGSQRVHGDRTEPQSLSRTRVSFRFSCTSAQQFQFEWEGIRFSS